MIRRNLHFLEDANIILFGRLNKMFKTTNGTGGRDKIINAMLK